MSDLSAPVIYKVGTLSYTRATLARLFFWLLWGDLCFMLMETVVPSILPIRLKSLHASNETVGLIMTTLPGLINAVANPIISFKSDRYRSRLGRRIPFILATLPWLVLSMIGFGYADRIRILILAHFPHSPFATSQASEIWIIGVFMVAFYFFNSFVNSVFWYLFNDVVPEHLLARFMSLFRLVSILSASLYNFLVYPYAGSHSALILTAVSLLYLFGFGFMCFMVKEGRYPPPPPLDGNRTGPLDYVRTFVKECLTLPHYWLVFLTTCFGTLAGATAAFSLYYFQATGLNLTQIGRVNGLSNIVVGALIPISGWLADRYHPIRIVLLGNLLNVLVAIPAMLVWLIWRPPPTETFATWIVIIVVIGAPVGALTGVYDPPLFMRIFPRSRYGQYCSANAMLRSIAAIIGGVSAGAFFDFAGGFMPKSHVYFLGPIWSLVFAVPALITTVLLYRSWKRYGGDDGYIPPVPGESLAQRMSEEIVEEGPDEASPGIQPPVVPV